jgi:hypothetical protein
MKIIGAGFGRTGTLSVKTAIEELGYGPCYHMKTALTRPWHIPFWIHAEKKTSKQWQRFFRNYNATVDWPASEFYKELMQAWPQAKVILTVRDPERWYESALKTIYRIQQDFPWWFPNFFFKLQEKHIWQGRFEGRFEDRDFAIQNFNQYIEEVKSYVPKENLLVFNVKDGWGPLCDYLNVPVPDKPFPHLHDKDTYLKYIRTVKTGFIIAGAGILLILVSAALSMFV